MVKKSRNVVTDLFKILKIYGAFIIKPSSAGLTLKWNFILGDHSFKHTADQVFNGGRSSIYRCTVLGKMKSKTKN